MFMCQHTTQRQSAATQCIEALVKNVSYSKNLQEGKRQLATVTSTQLSLAAVTHLQLSRLTYYCQIHSPATVVFFVVGWGLVTFTGILHRLEHNLAGICWHPYDALDSDDCRADHCGHGCARIMRSKMHTMI